MLLIRITGSEALLQGLSQVEGLHLSVHSSRKNPSGTWTVSAYASQEAVSNLKRIGCSVAVAMSEEQVRSAIRRGQGPNPTTP
jgi:hypothetical protein